MADLLNVVTPISTIQENASNAWKRLGQIKGFLTVSSFDILFSGSKFHPIVYCINQKTVDVLFGMEMEASNGRIRMQARHVLDMSSRVWLLPSEDLE